MGSALRKWIIPSLFLLTQGFANLSYALTPPEKCQFMFRRLTGTTPKKAELDSCVALVNQGQQEAAANAIIDSSFLFYTDTLYYLFAPVTNEDDNNFVTLNDFLATLIGLAKDKQDIRRLLYDDLVYTCANAPGLPAYSNANNDHYEACFNLGIGMKDALVATQQSVLNPALNIDPEVGPAGMYTTRGFASVYYNAGTNRAPLRYTLMHFMCEEIDGFHDTTVPDDWVGQDVPREPSGEAAIFKNDCAGCHGAMDGMRSAYAHLDWDEEAGLMIYTQPAPGATPEQYAAAVVPKYNQNAGTFPLGRKIVNNSWVNYWGLNTNSLKVQWDANVPGVAFKPSLKPDEAAKGFGVYSGRGPKSLGRLFANSDQFARCMVKRAYTKMCQKEVEVNKSPEIRAFADAFKAANYSLPSLFAKVVSTCADQQK